MYSQASIAGPGGHNHVRAFYGEKEKNKAVVIDVKRMKLIKKVATKGLTPYPVDRAGYLDKVQILAFFLVWN